MRRRYKIGGVLLAKLFVTIVAIYAISRQVDLVALRSIAAADANYLFAAFGACCLIVLAQAQRWLQLTQAAGIPLRYKTSLQIVWLGHFINNILPASVAGDLLRGYALRYDGAPVGLWMGLLIAEKFVALVTACLIAFVLAAGFLSASVPSAVIISLGALLAAMAIGYVLIVATLWIWPPSTSATPDVLREGRDGLVILLCTPQGRATLAISLVINLLMGTALFLCGRAFVPDISLLTCIFAAPVMAIASAIPISYGGWGVREWSGVQLLMLFSVSGEAALVIALSYGIMNLASSVPGALFGQKMWAYLRARQRDQRELVET